ncbi:hypothetical protein [Luteolibacter sp. LG18]|uniref:hypothetical protein n=1 Tax=Luteolibacter sp. LG18 TaxID=2819286 RepID=UPI002B2E525A|nr:hypothetical protein llg_32210 [Luteolibacter sp. LG18]
MKALLFTALATAAAISPLAAQTTGYTTFIRQTQQSTGVVWDMPFTALTGSSASQLALETNGALFQLYAVKTSGNVSYLLDQKLVGAYVPTATVTITSQDPYTKVTRTRADKPFTVNINVAGLVSGTTTSGGTVIPDAAKKVLVQRFTTSYPAGGTLTMAQATAGTPKSTSYIQTNGLTATTYPVTGLTPAAGQLATKVSGEEWYLVHALADSTIVQTQIASGYIQILPVPSGSISGLANGDTIRFKAPTVTLPLQDLYPRSDTWLQVYPGNPVLGTVGTTVPGSMLVLDQEKADTRTLTLTNWDSVFKTDGVYTLELLTKTVFGTERLSYMTITVDRTLNVQATMVDY